jgi:hypothetical protein
MCRWSLPHFYTAQLTKELEKDGNGVLDELAAVLLDTPNRDVYEVAGTSEPDLIAD